MKTAFLKQDIHTLITILANNPSIFADLINISAKEKEIKDSKETQQKIFLGNTTRKIVNLGKRAVQVGAKANAALTIGKEGRDAATRIMKDTDEDDIVTLSLIHI